MLVRPSLYERHEENAETFKRWTAMHFRDLLNLKPSSDNTEGISRTLRYTNADGELFYTIHADDISIWKTQAYYAVSRRLDLENTRTVEEGERPVLPSPHAFGDEPMVWHLVNAEFAILEEHRGPQPAWDHVEAYHSLPLTLLSSQSEKSSVPACLLVTLTYTSSVSQEEGEEHSGPPKQLTHLQAEAVTHLSSDYSANNRVYTSIYRHNSDAQPDMHPTIAAGADGNGSWVACILVGGEVSETRRTHLRVQLDDVVNKRARWEGLGRRKLDWGVKVGVWNGEVFMS